MSRDRFLTREINQLVKRHGLSLRADACKAIQLFVEKEQKRSPDGSTVPSLVGMIVGKLKDNQVSSSIVDLASVSVVLQEEAKNRKNKKRPAPTPKVEESPSETRMLYDEFGDDPDFPFNSQQMAAIEQEELQAKARPATPTPKDVTPTIDNKTVLQYIQTIDAFDTPKLHYNHMRKTFRGANKDAKSMVKASLHGNADEKAAVLRERWHILNQRTRRHAMFAERPISVNNSKQEHHRITQIESLIGNEGEAWIFGVLTELREGKFYIEDLNRTIPVDLTHALVHVGLYTENCLVLAQGVVSNGVFIISELANPPPELRKDTLKVFPEFYYFGLHPTQRNPTFHAMSNESEFQYKLRLENMMHTRQNDMILMLSDVHLDDAQVLSKLEELFTGFKNMFLPCIVFMGNFCSTAYSVGNGIMEQRRAHFDELADLLAKFPKMCSRTQFIFQPGPNDPSMGNVLPQRSLAQYFTKKLRSTLKYVRFVSNPCRLLYFSQEIVLFRDNLLHKMRRNCVIPPNLDSINNNEPVVDLSQHMIETICAQGHLSPLPISTRPVYWNYDHALRMYPLPDVLVIADQVDQFEHMFDELYCFNPGPFSVDYSFVAFLPSQGQAQFSQIS